IVLALAPIYIGSAAFFLSLWPWQPALYHVGILVLLATTIVEVCLQKAPRIPFTCSWLPGRSNFHITFWLCVGLLMTLVTKWVEFEQQAILNAHIAVATLVVLGIIAMFAALRTVMETLAEEGELQFEEDISPAILGLGLNQDGALMIEPPGART